MAGTPTFVRLDETTRQELLDKAALEERSVSYLIRKAVENYLKK